MKLHQIAIAILVLCNYEIKVHGHKIKSVTCGRRLLKHEALIVDGSASKEGFWPWHASILHIDVNVNINYKCGGTLLNSNAIVTAAHCVHENGQPIVPSRVLIQLGRNNLKVSGPNSQEFEAFKIIPHPNYNISNLRNDIAIISLATKVTFNDYVQPICLWSANKIDLSEVVGKPGTVVGFGVTKTDKIAYTLQQAVMPVVSIATCLGSDNAFYGQFLSDFAFCAGSRNGTTACNGDSGGGIVFEDEGVYRIRGIVSLTQVRPGERRDLCKVDEYVVFTDVAKYIDWIEENVLTLPLPPTEVTAHTHKESSNDDNGINYCYFLGNDLTNAQIPREYCSDRCASTPSCTHFTWNAYNGGTCWMKKNRVTQSDAHVSHDNESVCGIVENVSRITWLPNDWAVGCDFWKNSLYDVRSSGAECSHRCGSTPGCTHYTWTDYNGGTCWMKQNAVSKSDAFVSKDKSAVCGVISDKITWNGNWALGCDFHGNDLQSVLSTGEECGGLCAANPQCTHFTWNNGTCRMKQNVVSQSDALVVRDKSRVCGVMIAEALTWNGNWALGCEFEGNDLGSVKSKGEECGAICAANPQCTHFTWSYGTCRVKKYSGVTKEAAVKVNDMSVTCGVIRSIV
ncbi:uncharacterized protein LOC119066670 [Bradysia coprophila]|uniref:uncharacterized protein LOC119066670 n=1 Tax=Bradysia coprophila TaxID=38358 RepID=UPI00187DB148|nr:uncharacterized protein LOC119066670 [Bradysia coprophila]